MSANWFEVSPSSGHRDGTVEVIGKSRHTGRSPRYSVITFKAAKAEDSKCTIAEAGKPEYVDIADTANSEAEGKVVTIIGVSNSAKLTFSLGVGDLEISLPSKYTVNSILFTDNGANISGDPGASAQYEFSINIFVPTNQYAETYNRQIIVTDEAGHQDQCLLTIDAAKAYITISEQHIELGYFGNPKTVSVTSNATWAIEGFEDGSQQWSNGGTLTATYNGYRDGQATFSSEPNEGIDREMEVPFKAVDTVEPLLVTQEGLRQRFVTADGKVFCIFGGGRFGVLKHHYIKLAYLESTGKQWIDTGFSFDYTKDTVFSAEAMSLSTGRTIILGNYYDANYRCMAIEFGGSSNSHPGAGRGYLMLKKSGALDIWASNADINVKRSISLSFTASSRKAVLNFDGEQKTGTVSAGTISLRNTTRMFIDARTTSLNVIQNPLRIYSAQIMQGGVLVRDFIPVLDEAGVACMYDKVSKEYFYNQGTGSFIAGY